MTVRQPISILHVEDDEFDVISLRRSFRRANIDSSIVTVRDGEEALLKLRGEAGREKMRFPFVMLIDINMPRMNGLELLQEIREDAELRDIVAFILTTSDHQDDIHSAYQLNVAGYLLKQADDAECLQTVTLINTFWNAVEFPVH